MKHYHLTITDNATGEIMREIDTDAIIGAADDGDGTAIFCITRCGLVELAATCTGALKAAEDAMEDIPKRLRKYIKKLAKENTKRK